MSVYVSKIGSREFLCSKYRSVPVDAIQSIDLNASSNEECVQIDFTEDNEVKYMRFWDEDAVEFREFLRGNLHDAPRT